MSTAEHQRQQVTVVSPFGQHRVDLPVHMPLSGFLPDILAMAGVHPNPAARGGDGWRLADADGRILATDSTLAANGIPPGAVIQLLGGPAEMRRNRPPAQPEPDGPVRPGPSSPPGPQNPPGPHNPQDSQDPQEPTAPVRPPARTSRRGRPDQSLLPGVGRAAIFARDRVLLTRHVPRSAVPTDQRADSLTPLERTEDLLPPATGRVGRLAAAMTAFTSRPARPGSEGVTPGPEFPLSPRTFDRVERAGQFSPADLIPGPIPPAGQDGPAQLDQEDGPEDGDAGGRAATAAAASPAAAAWPAGSRHAAGTRLMPADLTLAMAPTRLERARSRWRELDYIGQLDALITEPRLLHCATIAVVSPKGGVGKTTVTALLGTLLSLLRRDPIVAVDTNPDFGSLGRVLTPDQSWYVDDLAQLVLEDDELSLTALDSHLGRAVHGLLVVPAPTDPARMAALDEEAYSRVIARLKDFFSLILLDCGTGLQDPASAAAIAAADQVVLLTDAQPATASLVAESTDLLHQWGRPITVVVNRMPAKDARLDVQQLSRYLPAARGLVVVPDDMVAASRLAAGSFDWRDGPPTWQLALRQLAIVLVSDWRRLGLAR
jgi:MinD-like ATPase involved in chromosome partitioning or flagellar assembly